jgi:type II secretory pathway pseudopilin PulG
MKSVSSERGSIAVIAALVIAVVLLIGVGLFAMSTYQKEQDYKNNVDQKVAVAQAAAKQQESAAKDKEFAEISKSPLKTYVGPEDYGSIILKYPKTWSGYVVNQPDSPYLDGYFQPGVVPDTQNTNSTFALRMQVSSDSYSSVLGNYQSQVQDGTVKIVPYHLPKVPSVVGSKITGQIEDEKTGTLILLPLRANALQIWTESSAHLSDFNKYIIPNLSFSP